MDAPQDYMIRQQARIAPKKPGVYFFLANNTVLYVGKAKNLRARLSSYFSQHTSDKTRLMVSKATTIEYIITRNEVEALLLENKLINQHKPPYNIQLKDTRRYAWIVVTKEEYPRIFTARNKKRAGTYYGPYTDGSARRAIIVTLNKTFKLRTCRKLPKKVCLQYHIGNCAGPCEGHDTKHSYNERVRRAQAILEGKTEQLRSTLTQEMQAAAHTQYYERAKELRDTLSAIDEIERKQVVERHTTHDQVVIAFAHNQEEAVAVVITIHRGVIQKKQEYHFDAHNTPDTFITALYKETLPPTEIITHDLTNASALEEYFTQTQQLRVHITQPQRGEKKRLLDLAQENAQDALHETNTALSQLKERLHLSVLPRVIDCFDVSTLQGTSTVAASVRYRNGQPDPSGYRRYAIRGAQQDDYAGIQEAVERRYAKEPLPDLVVIDGGRGQLQAALNVVPRNTPVIALAKQEEEIYVPGLSFPLRLNETDQGLLLLRRIRDATHRQAVGYHRKKRSQAMTASALDHISGLGEKRKELLYTHFKTFSRITQASKEDLQKVLGEKTGARVYESLRKEQV